jgi:3-oxoadipate enol-lactonase
VEIECVASRPQRAHPEAKRLARRSGFLERDGERLYWEEVGAGPPLVLCHGAGGNHAIWYQQVPVLGTSRRVVTWDHRGFGRSSDRADRSGPEVAVADLAALLDHLAVERADVVGQSMGGWTALGLALAHPERVRTLTLADTLGGIATAAIEARQRELLARRGVLAPGAELGLHPALDPSLRARDPARGYLYQMLGGFGEPDLGKIGPRLFATRRSAEALAALRAPVLFLVGDRDPLFPPALVREAAGLVPDARVAEIPGCGHSPYFEAPEAWNACLEQFLRSADA